MEADVYNPDKQRRKYIKHDPLTQPVKTKASDKFLKYPFQFVTFQETFRIKGTCMNKKLSRRASHDFIRRQQEQRVVSSRKNSNGTDDTTSHKLKNTLVKKGEKKRRMSCPLSLADNINEEKVENMDTNMCKNKRNRNIEKTLNLPGACEKEGEELNRHTLLNKQREILIQQEDEEFVLPSPEDFSAMFLENERIDNSTQLVEDEARQNESHEEHLLRTEISSNLNFEEHDSFAHEEERNKEDKDLSLQREVSEESVCPLTGEVEENCALSFLMNGKCKENASVCIDLHAHVTKRKKNISEQKVTNTVQKYNRKSENNDADDMTSLKRIIDKRKYTEDAATNNEEKFIRLRRKTEDDSLNRLILLAREEKRKRSSNGKKNEVKEVPPLEEEYANIQIQEERWSQKKGEELYTSNDVNVDIICTCEEQTRSPNKKKNEENEELPLTKEVIEDNFCPLTGEVEENSPLSFLACKNSDESVNTGVGTKSKKKVDKKLWSPKRLKKHTNRRMKNSAKGNEERFSRLRCKSEEVPISDNLNTHISFIQKAKRKRALSDNNRNYESEEFTIAEENGCLLLGTITESANVGSKLHLYEKSEKEEGDRTEFVKASSLTDSAEHTEKSISIENTDTITIIQVQEDLANQTEERRSRTKSAEVSISNDLNTHVFCAREEEQKGSLNGGKNEDENNFSFLTGEVEENCTSLNLTNKKSGESVSIGTGAKAKKVDEEKLYSSKHVKKHTKRGIDNNVTGNERLLRSRCKSEEITVSNLNTHFSFIRETKRKRSLSERRNYEGNVYPLLGTIAENVNVGNEVNSEKENEDRTEFVEANSLTDSAERTKKRKIENTTAITNIQIQGDPIEDHNEKDLLHSREKNEELYISFTCEEVKRNEENKELLSIGTQNDKNVCSLTEELEENCPLSVLRDRICEKRIQAQGNEASTNEEALLSSKEKNENNCENCIGNVLHLEEQSQSNGVLLSRREETENILPLAERHEDGLSSTKLQNNDEEVFNSSDNVNEDKDLYLRKHQEKNVCVIETKHQELNKMNSKESILSSEMENTCNDVNLKKFQEKNKRENLVEEVEKITGENRKNYEVALEENSSGGSGETSEEEGEENERSRRERSMSTDFSICSQNLNASEASWLTKRDRSSIKETNEDGENVEDAAVSKKKPEETDCKEDSAKSVNNGRTIEKIVVVLNEFLKKLEQKTSFVSSLNQNEILDSTRETSGEIQTQVFASEEITPIQNENVNREGEKVLLLSDFEEPTDKAKDSTFEDNVIIRDVIAESVEITPAENADRQEEETLDENQTSLDKTVDSSRSQNKIQSKSQTVCDDEESEEEDSSEDSTSAAESSDEDGVNQEMTKKLKKLSITIPWEVPKLHKIETRVSTGPKPRQKEEMKRLEIPIKLGIFNKSEDKQIESNWKEFCKLHNLPEDPTSFTSLSGLKSALLPTSERIKFVRFLAHGLDNRPLHSVYKRFQKLFSNKNIKRGAFTKEEDKTIREFMEKTTTKTPYFELAKILNRDRNAIYNRAKKLKNNINDQHVVWNKKKIKKFLRLFLKITQNSQIEDLKNKQFSHEEWLKLSKKMKIPILKLQSAWSRTIYPRVFIEKSVSFSKIKSDVLEILADKAEDDWRNIDWREIAKKFPGFTPYKLNTLFKRMVQVHVPEEKQKNLQDCLKYLSECNVEKRFRTHVLEKLEVEKLLRTRKQN